MLTCKQVSKTLARVDYQKLSPVKKVLLKLHVKLCAVCGKYNRQVMDTQDMCRHYREKEEAEVKPIPQLSPERRAELQRLLDIHSRQLAEREKVPPPPPNS